MSDDGPKINVTRGKRADKEKKSNQAQSGSSAPGAMEVATGLAQRAREMWLAGLGALSLAEEAGTKVFDALVEEGKSWEQAQRERREQRARQVRRATRESDAIQAAEERVQEEVNAALQRIGVPSRDDVDALKDQIEALNDRVDRLTDAVRHTDA